MVPWNRRIAVGAAAALLVVVVGVVVGLYGHAGVGKPSPEVARALPVVSRYLEMRRGGGSRRTEDGWTWFCAVRYMGNSRVADEFRLYVWEVCQEYRPYKHGLGSQTGSSLPAVITMKRTSTGYRPVAELQPREDPEGESDVERMFPRSARSIIREMPLGPGPGTAAEMDDNLRKRAQHELLSG